MRICFGIRLASSQHTPQNKHAHANHPNVIASARCAPEKFSVGFMWSAM